MADLIRRIAVAAVNEDASGIRDLRLAGDMEIGFDDELVGDRGIGIGGAGVENQIHRGGSGRGSEVEGIAKSDPLAGGELDAIANGH